MSIDVTTPLPLVRQLTINRPDKKNALDTAMYAAMTNAIASADSDPDVRVIVITGAKGSFTSGNDLADFLAGGDAAAPLAFLRSLVLASTPVIAAVEGPAIGIGSTMLLHCDLAIAARSAKFQLPFTRLGLTPEGGSSFLLPRVAGPKLAAELLLFGDVFSPDVALRAGLINAVVDDDEALPRALGYAGRLRDVPHESVRATKALLLQGQRDQILAAIDREIRVFQERLSSDESVAIISAMSRR